MMEEYEHISTSRILESRIGRLIEYYCKEIFGMKATDYIKLPKDDVVLYTWIFMTPVLLAFSVLLKDESLKIIKAVIIQNKVGIKSHLTHKFRLSILQDVMVNMYNLCVDWNEKMDKGLLNKIKDTIDLKFFNYGKFSREYDEKNEFYQPFLSANLLVDSYGVIGKHDYVSKDYYYIRNKEEKYFLEEVPVNDCEERDEKSCEESPFCLLRKDKCYESSLIKGINRNSIGTLKSFYNFALYDENEPSHIYKVIDIFDTGLGYITIFEEYLRSYDVEPENILIPSKKYRILFPALGDLSGSTFSHTYNTIKNMYVGARLKQVSDGNVRVHSGIWNMINSWYESTKEIIRNIPKDADVYLVGCSLGGAMANVMALKLILEGNIRREKLHLYAFGAPRIGNTECGEVISGGVANDSANFIKLNNIISEDNRLYTQFDFVTRLPASEFCMFSDCRFVDNPKIRCMSSGFFFNPVLNTFKTQPEIPFGVINNIIAYSKFIPKFGNGISKYLPKIGPPISWYTCKNLAWLNHSLTIYSKYGFAGVLNNEEEDDLEIILVTKRDCV